MGLQWFYLALTSLSLEVYSLGHKASFLGSAYSWPSGLDLYWLPLETQTFYELIFRLIISYTSDAVCFRPAIRNGRECVGCTMLQLSELLVPWKSTFGFPPISFPCRKAPWSWNHHRKRANVQHPSFTHCSQFASTTEFLKKQGHHPDDSLQEHRHSHSRPRTKIHLWR